MTDKTNMDMAAALAADNDNALPIAAQQTRELTAILEKYKAGKARTEQRIISSENWWKLRNATEEQRDTQIGADGGFTSVSGWLHNVIVSKHADAVEAYPMPNILPREAGDREEAQILSDIIPCVMEQNHFDSTYSAVMWQKLKTGTGVYKIVWDKNKLNGLGDIAIERVNLLNIYWEPGITDIQRSRYFFHTELCDKDVLGELYPELKDKLKGQSFVSTKFLYDDRVDTENKATVIECYYHKNINGKQTVQYVKYVDDAVLFATENDPELAPKGLYEHGKYPYVFDVLYPIEGSPCGYGYVDICRNPQTVIDLLNTAFVKNAMVGAVPRFLSRQDGSVNEAELLDLKKPIIHVNNSSLGEDSLRQLVVSPLSGIYVNVLDRTVQELRETSGNTEASTGSISSGVTAASAIAALQEASGKGSRDSTLSSYRAYSEIVNIVIELIRQFYDIPRQFRIVGQYGTEYFVKYTNKQLKEQPQGNDFGVDMGCRLPVFDIKVSAQKRNVYTQVSQNELALQFFQLGFFNPQMADQALMTMDMMEFEGKDGLMQKISQNSTMFQKLVQYMQLALTLARTARPDMVEGLSKDIMQTVGTASAAGAGGSIFDSANMGGEDTRMQQARERSRRASQEGGAR